MSIDVTVSGGTGAEPGFVAQRSPNGLTISAGPMGRDTSLLGVTRDQNGAMLNAFPAINQHNYVINPVFGVNISDGWGSMANCVRDAAPPVSLPLYCVAAARFVPPDTFDRDVASVYFTIDPTCHLYWASCYFYRPGGYRTRIAVAAYGEESGETYIDIYDDDEDDTEFVRRFHGFSVADDATLIRFDLFFYDNDVGRDAWFTGFMLEPDYYDSDDPSDFATGDTPGWTWDGTAHNSPSRRA